MRPFFYFPACSHPFRLCSFFEVFVYTGVVLEFGGLVRLYFFKNYRGGGNEVNYLFNRVTEVVYGGRRGSLRARVWLYWGWFSGIFKVR